MYPLPKYIIKTNTITIGELVDKYFYLLIWTGINLINLLINKYAVMQIKMIQNPFKIGTTSSNAELFYCSEYYYEVYDRLEFNTIIIYIGIFICFLVFIFFNRVKEFGINKLFGFGYFLSWLFKVNYIDENLRDNCRMKEYVIVVNIRILYMIIDVLNFTLMFLLIPSLLLTVCGFICNYIFDPIINYYNENIKNIKINYYEKEVVTIEKVA